MLGSPASITVSRAATDKHGLVLRGSAGVGILARPFGPTAAEWSLEGPDEPITSCIVVESLEGPSEPIM